MRSNEDVKEGKILQMSSNENFSYQEIRNVVHYQGMKSLFYSY